MKGALGSPVYLFASARRFYTPSQRRRGATTVFDQNRHHRSDTASSFSLPVTHLTAIEPPRDRRRVASLHFRDCMAVVLRRHGGDGGDTAGGTAVMEVLLRSLYGATAVTTVQRRPHCGLTQPAVALRKF